MRTKEAIKSAVVVLITLMLIVLAVQLGIPSSETRRESSVIQAYPVGTATPTAPPGIPAYPIGTMTPTPPPFIPVPWPTAPPPVVTATPVLISPTPTPPLSDRARQALRYVSQTHNVPIEDLLFLIESVGNYPLTGRTIWQGKILDRISHQVYVVGIDEAGQIVDPSTIKQAEEDAAFQRYGKLEPALYDLLQTLGDEDRVKVSMWLSGVDERLIMAQIAAKYPEAKLIGSRPSKETDMALYSQIEAEMMEAKKQAYQLAEEPVIAFLEAKGFSVTYASRAAPLIFAELPKRVILELADRTEVSAIYLSKTAHLVLDSAIPTDRVEPVWERGITGSSYRIAVIEDNGVDFGHYALVDGLYYNSDNPNIWGGTVPGHATNVAGVIASTDETYRGVAYGGPGLLSANASSLEVSDIIAATEWAIDNDARVLNNSWGVNSYGELDDYAYYYDHVAREHGRTVVAATGNEGGLVISPALAYNVIAVGAIEDNNTATWSDDTMWNLSNFENPDSPWHQREKPEVVAVGADVRTTHPNNDWITRGGTSLAAPQVSGLASLLMQRSDWLKGWPEAIKAIIMASAVHPIETPSVPDPFDGIDDRDGAGAIDAALADTIAKNEWWLIRAIGSSPPSEHYYFDAIAGEKVRVVIVWPSHPDNNHPPSTDPLRSNLDLFVYKPSDPNTPIARSESDENNYEIVEFTAPETGQYSIQVAKTTFDDPSEYLGLAWVRTGTYLPDVRATFNGWTSWITIRNNGAMRRTITATFREPDNSPIGTYQCDLEANASCTFSAEWVGDGNFWGQAIVDGSEDVSVVVENRNVGAQMADAYNGIAPPGASGNPGFGTAGSPLYLPTIMHYWYGWDSEIVLQNVGSQTATVTIEYFPGVLADDEYKYYGNFGVQTTEVIPPGGHKAISQAPIWQLGQFLGSAKVTSDQPLAGIVNETNGSIFFTYDAFSSLSSTIFLPSILHNHYSYNTSLQIQNACDGDKYVDVTYKADTTYSSPPGKQVTSTHRVPAYSSVTTHEGYPHLSDLDGEFDHFFGSARIEGGDSCIAATVNQNSDDYGVGMDYNGLPSGNSHAILPVVIRQADGWSTSVNVQNLSASTITVDVTYYYSGGTQAAGYSRTIPANGVLNLYHKKYEDLPVPAGFQGSALIQSQSVSQPIAVMVNPSKDGYGDLAESYNAFNW